MKLVVGLGNPGNEYKNTRHNVGFIVVDNYLKKEKWIKEKSYEYLITNVFGEKVCFLKPLTYMNLSGQAVSKIVNFYKIEHKDILVVHDDLDLEVNKYRLKYISSAGGHNGIKSIIESIGGNDFCRLKIGIGHDSQFETKNYVLGKLDKESIEYLNSDIFVSIIDSFIKNGIDVTMNNFN